MAQNWNQYVHFTDEQKERARGTSLEELLRRKGEQLTRSGNEWRWKRHNSVTIRENQWYRHKTRQGGDPISFLQEFYNMTYAEAVTELIGGEHGVILPTTGGDRFQKRERKPFVPPPVHADMRGVFAYLMQKRHIAREVIAAFAHEKLIYESHVPSKDGAKTYRNAVFAGLDEHGVVRHACKQSIATLGQNWRGNESGSEAAHSFHRIGTGTRLYVFEAPIDMLSFITMYSLGWQEHSYVALCGVAEHALLHALASNPHLEQVILCLDHDEAGIEAAGRLAETVKGKGYRKVGALWSRYKDWNEDLKAAHGLPAQPAEEHPQFALCAEVCCRISCLCEAAQKSENPAAELPPMLAEYRAHLSGGRRDNARACAEELAAFAVCTAVREYRQMGRGIDAETLIVQICTRFAPHQNRESIRNRTTQIARAMSAAIGKPDAILTSDQKGKRAEAFLHLATDCIKVAVRLDAEIQEDQRQEDAPAMTAS